MTIPEPNAYVVAKARVAVNAARTLAGAPPLVALPRGNRGVEVHCPLQNALSDIGVLGVGNSGITCARPEQAVVIAEAWGETAGGLCGLNVPLTDALRLFVTAWDNDQLTLEEVSA